MQCCTCTCGPLVNIAILIPVNLVLHAYNNTNNQLLLYIVMKLMFAYKIRTCHMPKNKMMTIMFC